MTVLVQVSARGDSLLCGQRGNKIWNFKTSTHIFAPVLLTITYQERQREMAQ